MKNIYLILSLLYPFSIFTTESMDFENNLTLACELLIDCGSNQANEDKYLEYLKEFIRIFPHDEFDDPQQFLSDAFQFIKTIIEKIQHEQCIGIFRVGEKLELERELGIHIGLELQTGSDSEEQKRWNAMFTAVTQVMHKNNNTKNVISFIEELIKIIPPVISPINEENQFKEDSCGNRFKFNFDLC